MTSLSDDVYRRGVAPTEQGGPQKEPVVACHDLWRSCWVQGDHYQKYQAANSVAPKLPKMESPFNPSNFQPASVFLRTSSVKNKPHVTMSEPQTTTSVSIKKDMPKTNSLTTTTGKLPSAGSLQSSGTDELDAAFDRSYEFALRKNASLGFGLASKHSSTPSLNKVISTASYQSPLVLPASSSSMESKQLSDTKRLDFLKQHMLLSSSQSKLNSYQQSTYGCYSVAQNNAKVLTTSSHNNDTSISSNSEVPNKTSTPMTSGLSTTKTSSFASPLGSDKSSLLLTNQTNSYPLQYGTLPNKSKSKPRPLQSRSGTLQRHKSSAEIYSKTSTTSQPSSLNRLLSISAEDIRRSLKETNGVIQRLIGNAKKRASIKQLDSKTDEDRNDSSNR